MNQQVAERPDVAALFQPEDSLNQNNRSLERNPVESVLSIRERGQETSEVVACNVPQARLNSLPLDGLVSRHPVVVKDGEADNEEERERKQRAPMRRKRFHTRPRTRGDACKVHEG